MLWLAAAIVGPRGRVAYVKSSENAGTNWASSEGASILVKWYDGKNDTSKSKLAEQDQAAATRRDKVNARTTHEK